MNKRELPLLKVQRLRRKFSLKISYHALPLPYHIMRCPNLSPKRWVWSKFVRNKSCWKSKIM